MYTPEETKFLLVNHNECTFSGNELFASAHGHIEQLEATQPKWISVEERLPEPYRTYLVVLKEKYAWEAEWRYHVDVADLQDDGGYIENRWNTFNDWYEGQEIHVTHWMPLPVPPEVE